ncbi:helix-turn-helix domain-containing protein [Streptomyces aidingensis]|uniref:helix-turn-helix domain-containing protein n=1 Tax=Streptomyces aidingensis TaxID=910347 RepID=UPI000D1B75D7|nr:helix-turn-helix domain-containing protein [Streptomyces aidingensis]
MPRLSENDVRLFQWVCRHGELDSGRVTGAVGLSETELSESLAALSALCLVRRLGHDPARYVPVAPEVAIAALVTPHEEVLRRRLADTERLRHEIGLLAPLYAEGRRHQRVHEPLLEVTQLETVVGLITDTAARCRREVRTCQPGGGRSPHVLEQAYARDLDMLRRGVRMRTLYQHTARHHRPTQEYVRRMSEHGAEVRTLSELFGRMIAFDSEIVFIPHRDDPDAAVVIHDPSTVAYLCAAFDHAWSLAEPYHPAWSESPAREEVKMAIVRLLAQGMKDEVVARRLGMSLRTCRKHIAEMMEQLGAYSRFQAGYLARVQLSEPPAAPGAAP